MRQYSPHRMPGGLIRRGAFLASLLAALCVPAAPARAAAGDLDVTFGFFGKIAIPANSAGTLYALQADGKILSAGRGSGAGLTDFVIGRVTPQGSLDPDFGTGGRATVNFGFFGGVDSNDMPFGIDVQPDGRIVVAGRTNAPNVFKWDFAFARLDTDGSLDPTFGIAGRAALSFGNIGSNDELRAVRVQPDGRIVAGGYTDLGIFGVSDFAVARLTPDGLPDPTFGVNGRVSLDFDGAASTDEGVALALQPDGRILLAGTSRATGPGGGIFNFALARFEPDGSLDAGFGTGGKALIEPTGMGLGAIMTDVALAPDGKIVVAGYFSVPGSPLTNRQFLILRLDPDGSPDTGFGAGGRVVLDFSGSGSDDRAFSAAVQADGKILVGGDTRSLGGAQGFALVRLRVDGTLDGTFGAGGKVQTRFGGVTATEGIRKVLIQPDRKIVAAGFSSPIGALVRYLNDARPDERLEDLIALVEELGLPAGTERSLLAKLDHALAVLDLAAPDASCRLLRAFGNEVDALDGKAHLPAESAAQLRSRAGALETLLGCARPDPP